MTEIKRIKTGSRGSRLALRQVGEVATLLEAEGKGLPFETVTFDPPGDRDKTTPLTENLPDDFWTRPLDEALLKGKIDIAVHSAKDLPEELHPALEIFALTRCEDDTDCFIGNAPFEKLEKGARVGTSSLLRQRAVKELRPDIETVDIRGNIEQRIQYVRDGRCDGIITATIALKRLGLEDEITDIMPWEGFPLQGQLAVVGRKGDKNLKELFSAIDVRRSYGKVVLVGAGPGDPDLLTLKGVKALAEADCVFYDYLTDKEMLKHAPRAEKIYVGKRKGAHSLPQSELSKMLRKHAMEGKTVARLKSGDPLIFGRGADEIDYLKAYHIDVEVIPGVSSATAIPSALGIPLTARDVSSSVAFVSGHSKGERADSPRPVEIPDVDTVVFLMGLTKLGEIVRSMKKKGWPSRTPVAVISRGTRPDEKVLVAELATVEREVESAGIEQPALIVAGEVVKFYRKGTYRFERTLYTGTNPSKYRAFGELIHHPMIRIRKADVDPRLIQNLIYDIEKYHGIIFTSRFAVRYFFDVLRDHQFPFLKLVVKDMIVIGKDTAQALGEYEFMPTLRADVETSEGLLEKLKTTYDLKGKKLLFPRSSVPNPYLQRELKKLGAEVTALTVYENSKPEKRALPGLPIDNVIFTSPSTVRNFLEDYGRIPDGWRIWSKGPLTSRSLKESGYKCEVYINDAVS